jgi:hypothetical protein
MDWRALSMRWSERFGTISGRRGSRTIAAVAGVVILVAAGTAFWNARAEKRVRVVVPGKLVRGAWQNPQALREIIGRERIKTIVTLSAINRDDPKYVSQASVVNETGVRWILVPMRGSRASLEQMAEAADLLADPTLQPVYFHCVAGHHRTSLAHAAYLIRECHYSAEQAWRAVSEFPWSRPGAPADENDRSLIHQFALNHAVLISARDAQIQ